MSSKSALSAFIFLISSALIHAQSTTVVSLTSTTIVHATASDYANACNNFYGACVVYGDNDANGAAYTTTVYRDSSPSPTGMVTSTTIVETTTTASDAAACQDFEGACVVYAGNGDAAYTTTAAGYHGGQAAGQQVVGNSDGYIARDAGPQPGVIGAAASLPQRTWFGAACCIGTLMGVAWA